MLCQKGLFDIPPEVCYLNTAYMSPLLKEGMEVGIQSLGKKLRPYEMEVKDFFEPVDKLKQLFAKMVNIENHLRTVVIPSVSYGIANVIQNIPFSSGDEIVLAGDQFPSNVYPWIELVKEKNGRIVTIPSPSNNHLKGDTWSEGILNAINSRTKIVALPHVHWSEGVIFNLREISNRIHSLGGYLIIDGTQSIGALPFDVSEILPDALIVAGYKWLMGPYGIGLAYYNDRFDDGIPIENNWINRLNSEDFAGLVNYEENYKPFSFRYGVGESSNFAAVPVLSLALERILNWGPSNIQDYCGKISTSAINILKDQGFEIGEVGQRSNHLFGIKLPDNIHLQDLKSVLKKNQIYVSIRGDFIRVSPYVMNDAKDLHRLADVLLGMKSITWV